MDKFDWIKETEQDFQSLFRRMDADADLYNQVEYQLRDLETGNISRDVVNVTMNDPKVFADKVQALMSESSMQTVVSGRHLSDTETTLIENFDSDIRYEIDNRLMLKDISSLYSFQIEQACIRGTVAGRYVGWEKDGLFIPDLLPCDSRYLLYEYGERELERAAFKTIRSKASILEKYPNAEINAKKGGILEDWDIKRGRIWLVNPFQDIHDKGQLLKEIDNVFGYVPFIIQGVGAGSMLQDERGRKHRFESIFANNRLLNEHLNMLASILQTLTYMSFNRVHLWESEAGTLAQKPPRPGSRKTIPIDKGTRGLFPMDVADIKNATRLIFSMLLSAYQRGALPNTEYGNLTFQLSAVAISKLGTQRDTIISPRLRAISLFFRKLHYLIRDQYVEGGYEAELGEEGLERTYKASDLDKKYRIKYEFHSVSPEQNIANYAVAQQALAVGVSKKTVFTDIVKFQDPEGEIMKAQAEQASQIDPVLALYDYGHALIEKREYFKADLIKDKIKQLLRERYMPQQQPTKIPAGKTASPKSMIPLLEGGGGGQMRSEFEEMPPEEMMEREERRAEVVRKQASE